MENYDTRFVPSTIFQYYRCLVFGFLFNFLVTYASIFLTGRILVHLLPWSERLRCHILVYVLCLDPGEH